MLDYAVKMAKHHHTATEEDVQKLRDVGFSDADILDMIYWIAGFNMANTINDCVGLEVHEHVRSIFVDTDADVDRTVDREPVFSTEVVRPGWERARVRALENPALDWINSKPLNWQCLAGKTLLVTYWDVTHPNSLAAISHLNAWLDAYASQDLMVIAIHAPEFPNAKNVELLRDEVGRLGIKYPVVHVPDYRSMQGANNRYWPTTQIIDKDGYYRFRHYGPGAFDQIEQAILQALQFDPDLESPFVSTHENHLLSTHTTPELFPGFQHGSRQFGMLARPGTICELTADTMPELHQLCADGKWTIETDGMTLEGNCGRLSFNYRSDKVFIYVSPPSTGAASIQVLLDNEALPGEVAGIDVSNGKDVRLPRSGSYSIARHRRIKTHRIDLIARVPGTKVHRISFLPFRGVSE